MSQPRKFWQQSSVHWPVHARQVGKGMRRRATSRRRMSSGHPKTLCRVVAGQASARVRCLQLAEDLRRVAVRQGKRSNGCVIVTITQFQLSVFYCARKLCQSRDGPVPAQSRKSKTFQNRINIMAFTPSYRRGDCAGMRRICSPASCVRARSGCSATP